MIGRSTMRTAHPFDSRPALALAIDLAPWVVTVALGAVVLVSAAVGSLWH